MCANVPHSISDEYLFPQRTHPGSLHQCFGSRFNESGSSILGWIPIWIRIKGFDDQNLEKNSWKKDLVFFLKKIAIYLSYLIYIKDVKVRYYFPGVEKTLSSSQLPVCIRLRQYSWSSSGIQWSVNGNKDVFFIFCSRYWNWKSLRESFFLNIAQTR